MINYGIVGTGYFGADLARSINKIEDAKVIAVFDPNHAEEIAEELNLYILVYDCNMYTLNDMLMF